MPRTPSNGLVRITRVELVWPGKYTEDGTRRLVRPPALPLTVVARYPAGVRRSAGQRGTPAATGTVWCSGNVFQGRAPSREPQP